jgi:hypothetical protein
MMPLAMQKRLTPPTRVPAIFGALVVAGAVVIVVSGGSIAHLGFVIVASVAVTAVLLVLLDLRR